jgi:ribonuclease P protein component
MLNKDYRINKKKDYNNIYDKGKKIPGKYMVVFIAASQCEHSRFGIVASKKVGHAVERNLAKRRLRTVIYQNMGEIKDKIDVIVVARPAIKNAGWDQVNDDYRRIMRRAGLC